MDIETLDEFLVIVADENQDDDLFTWILFDHMHILKHPNVYITFNSLEQRLDGPSIFRRFRFRLDGLRSLHQSLQLPPCIVSSVCSDMKLQRRLAN